MSATYGPYLHARYTRPFIKSITVQYFYSFAASYNAFHEASQMVCFTTQCYQNKKMRSLVRHALTRL